MGIRLIIISDLHLEFRSKYTTLINEIIQETASCKAASNKKSTKKRRCILILAGDISTIADDIGFSRYDAFISKCYPHFKYIIHVPGNHEYFITNKHNIYTMAEIEQKLKDYASSRPKLRILNNECINLRNKYYIIGSTLWSMPINDSVVHLSNDYSSIYLGKRTLLKPADVIKMYKKSYKYLNEQIKSIKASNAKAKIIVVSHHAPYICTNINQLYRNTMNSLYMTDTTGLMKPPVVAWIYGHIHVHDDMVINGVKVVSNPYGYPRQRTDYKTSSFII